LAVLISDRLGASGRPPPRPECSPIVHPDLVAADVRRLISIPRNAPAPGAASTQPKVCFFRQRTKQRQFADAGIPFSSACPWHPFLHALVEETKTAWEAVLGICRGGKGPQGRVSGRERVTRWGEEALIKMSNIARHPFHLCPLAATFNPLHLKICTPHQPACFPVF